MPRVKRGAVKASKRRNLLKKTKGFMWGRKNKVKLAKPAIKKAGVNAYRDRRDKKRDLRTLWNTRINAAARVEGTTYSRLIAGLKKQNISLDRKILSELAVNEPAAFKAVVKTASKK